MHFTICFISIIKNYHLLEGGEGVDMGLLQVRFLHPRMAVARARFKNSNKLGPVNPAISHHFLRGQYT